MNPHFPKSVAALKEREEQKRLTEKEAERTKPIDIFGPILAVIFGFGLLAMCSLATQPDGNFYANHTSNGYVGQTKR